MNDETSGQSTITSGNFDGRFDRYARLAEKFAFEVEKNFTFEVLTIVQDNRVYFKRNKDQASDENLFH